MGIAITITLVIIANICLFAWMIKGSTNVISRLEKAALLLMLLTAVVAGVSTIAQVWLSPLIP